MEGKLEQAWLPGKFSLTQSHEVFPWIFRLSFTQKPGIFLRIVGFFPLQIPAGGGRQGRICSTFHGKAAWNFFHGLGSSWQLPGLQGILRSSRMGQFPGFRALECCSLKHSREEFSRIPSWKFPHGIPAQGMEQQPGIPRGEGGNWCPKSGKEPELSRICCS